MNSNELHRNLISDEEDCRTEGCLVDFEEALDKLLADAAREANEIGGYFRGPGIRASLQSIYKARVNRRWLKEDDHG